MGEKAIQLYQGNDWLTYRWSVAQVFDTLDRVREVCSHAPVALSISVVTSATGMPRYDLNDDELMADIFGCLVELCDDLAGEIDAVLADLFAPESRATSLRWLGFEMQLHLQAFRQQVLLERQSVTPAPDTIDRLMNLVTRMRDILKNIDQ